VWQFWQGTVRLPCGLRETEPLDWLLPRGARALPAKHKQPVITRSFANETLGDKFSAHLVSNKEALEIPTTVPVSSLLIREKQH
jgi:hypothetical protein